MPRYRPPLRRIACALLTLWLGLWPAADAVTGATLVVVVEPATGSAGPRCPLPASIIAQGEAPGCCPLDLGADAAGSGCRDTGRNRCGRCFFLGGMVLFAVAQWRPEADHAVRGTVDAAAVVAPTRHLQPPVPPPWAVS